MESFDKTLRVLLRAQSLEKLYALYKIAHDKQVKIAAIIRAQKPGLINQKTEDWRKFKHTAHKQIQLEIYKEIERRADIIPTSYLINKIYKVAAGIINLGSLSMSANGLFFTKFILIKKL